MGVVGCSRYRNEASSAESRGGMDEILGGTLSPVRSASGERGGPEPGARSPKDTFITVYGRKPVLEALHDAQLRVDKVILADGLRGEPVRAITAAARERDVP